MAALPHLVGSPTGGSPATESIMTTESLSLITAARTVTAPAAERNIVFFITDDESPTLGCYGDGAAVSPAIDAVAADGTLFRNAFATTASCSASRSVVMSGLHNHANGQYGHQHAFHKFASWDNLVSLALPRVLVGAGYRTAHIGKYHVAPEEVYRFETYLKGNTRNAVQMAERCRGYITDTSDERPFFLYFPTTVPHLALQVPDDSLAEYLGTFDDTPYLGDRRYLPHIAPRAAYAAMITRMDRDVGRIMALLKELGLDENTLVIFTSDNGPTFLKGPDTDFFESAGPLRGKKGSLYEGGIRVPMIARWPSRIAAGTKSELVGAFWDVLPTLAAVAGAEQNIPGGIDGISFLPTLLGNSGQQQQHDYLFWAFYEGKGGRAIRQGPWKAVQQPYRGPIRLYNLASDLGESHDLAAAEPERVEALRALMDRAYEPSVFWHFPPGK